MNQRLSTWLLFGALFLWPLMAHGQETNSNMARTTTPNTPSFQVEGPSEISRGTGVSVSVRELSIGLSTLLCNQRKFTEAEPIIRKALELAPGFGPGHFTLAWALFGLNRPDEAEKNAHEALMRDPSLALAHLLLANICSRRTDYSAVLAELDAYLKLTPDGALSDKVRLVQESLRRKLAKSVVIVEPARAKP